MKVWIKLLAGAAVGVILGIVLPFQESGLLERAIEFLPQLAIRAGRYITPPLVIFSLTVAIYQLRQEGRFWPLVGKSLLVILATSAIVLTFGIGAVRLFFSNERIPIIVENVSEVTPVGIKTIVDELFPSNMLSLLAKDGLFLFPLCIAAFFMALGLSLDKNHSKPVLALFDSLSRIFYHIAAFFCEILELVIIILAAYFAWRYRLVMAKGIFTKFIRFLFIITLLFSFLVLPLSLYLLKPRRWTTLWAKVYGSLATAIAAFFSGDINFTLPTLFLHNKENLGINRRVNTVAPLLFSIIGRSGSAMIAAVSFIVILQSYSSLEIQLDQVIQIGGYALLLSLLLGRNSGDGAFAALATLCLWAPNGFETGYLIMKPISFYLIACGTLIDCMAATFGTYVLARLGPDFVTDKSAKNFI
jgi:Na+/H+-dicarboxylate symporter